MKVVFEEEDEKDIDLVAAQFGMDHDLVAQVIGRKVWILMDINRAWLVTQIRLELRSMTQVGNDSARSQGAVHGSPRKSRKTTESG